MGTQVQTIDVCGLDWIGFCNGLIHPKADIPHKTPAHLPNTKGNDTTPGKIACTSHLVPIH